MYLQRKQNLWAITKFCTYELHWDTLKVTPFNSSKEQKYRMLCKDKCKAYVKHKWMKYEHFSKLVA